MEYALWDMKTFHYEFFAYVLILVVMEYALWGGVAPWQGWLWGVLILVVMEYALWVTEAQLSRFAESLNPCCNGICSLRWCVTAPARRRKSLNPCCNGICSLRVKENTIKANQVVLILVVMEYALWGWRGRWIGRWSLNPCCNGICSLRLHCLFAKI